MRPRPPGARRGHRCDWAQSPVSPLHVAAAAGSVRVVELLLSAGASPFARDRNERTPLFEAAREGRAGCVRAFLRAAGSCRGGAASGCSSLDNLANWTPLHAAAAGAHLEALSALLEHGADPNAAEGWGGDSPLHVLVKFGRHRHALLAAADGSGGGEACAVRVSECIQELLLHGARLGARNSRGDAVLQLAVEYRDMELAAATILALGGGGAVFHQQQPFWTVLPASLWARALEIAQQHVADLLSAAAVADAEARAEEALRAEAAGNGCVRSGSDPAALALWKAIVLAADRQRSREKRVSDSAAPGAPRLLRFTVALLDRAVRPTVLRKAAEKAAADAAGKALCVLEQWRAAAAAGGAEAEAPQQPRRGGGGGSAGGCTTVEEKLRFAAALCIAKWVSITDAARGARREEIEAQRGIAAEVWRMEERVKETGTRHAAAAAAANSSAS